MLSLFNMAKKAGKISGKTRKSKAKTTDAKGLKQEKGETVNLRQLARDERTWKIVGAIFILFSIFLFIAFISYFFTWKEDQDKVFGAPRY